MVHHTLPTRLEVIEVFETLIEGTISRQAASAWACQFILNDDVRIDDVKVWESLKKLGSVDLVGMDRPFLYETEDFRIWLTDLKALS